MGWIRRSFIFKPDGSLPWSRTHAQVPSPLLLDDRIRVYYATRDDKGRSLTSFIEVERSDPARILYVHDRPILGLGELGTHDEDGAMAGCLLADGDEVLFYYTGWSRGLTVPYRVSVGLAASRDGGISFERVFEGPVVDRTPLEPHMTMSPFVMREGGVWKMWYGSGLKWVEIDGKPEPIYAIKYAESSDGRRWRQDNVLCIPQSHPLEANTRPSVAKTKNGYEMWFSYRHSVDFRNGAGGYRIGYAVSEDGKKWRREDSPPTLAPSGSGWDGRMTAYPAVLEADGRKIMFYNGDGFGRSGFGYAIWEE